MQKGPGKPNAPKGLIRLGIGDNATAPSNGANVTCDRDGYIFVPQSYQSNKTTAFLLALHDAGGNSSQPLELLAAAANASGGAAGLALPMLSGWNPSCWATELPANFPKQQKGMQAAGQGCYREAPLH